MVGYKPSVAVLVRDKGCVCIVLYPCLSNNRKMGDELNIFVTVYDTS
jgi:hypothetical protein